MKLREHAIPFYSLYKYETDNTSNILENCPSESAQFPDDKTMANRVKSENEINLWCQEFTIFMLLYLLKFYWDTTQTI